jgi:flagella basal body P-ring formation protein FlgA
MASGVSVLARRAALAAVCLALAATARAAAPQDPAAVQTQAERYLQAQTRGVPGKVTIRVRPPRSALPACAALEAFQPVGSRSVGSTIVGVRCLAPAPWTVYLSAQVRVIGRYAVTTQPLPPNHVLGASDVGVREGDLGMLPADVVSDPAAMLGYRTLSGLAAGAPLRTAVLRPPLAVQEGQTARVIVDGPGFSVQSEGQALANAGRGEPVRVRIGSGQVVSGIAQDGQRVMVAF